MKVGRPQHPENAERLEFIKANQHLSIKEMGEHLGIHINKVWNLIKAHGLTHGGEHKQPKQRPRSNKFFNVYSHADWLCGKSF